MRSEAVDVPHTSASRKVSQALKRVKVDNYQDKLTSISESMSPCAGNTYVHKQKNTYNFAR